MSFPLFAIPLNMGTGSWIITIIAGLGFVVMFGLSSAGGEYQDLINTTLENDALAREKRKNKKWLQMKEGLAVNAFKLIFFAK